MSGQTPDYLFGQLAGEAERLRLQARMFARYTARFLEDAGISPGMKVLDVGTGAGDVALLVAGLVGREGTVVGIDFNSELIETAQARAATAGIENVSFVVGDAASALAGSTASSASPLPIAPKISIVSTVSLSPFVPKITVVSAVSLLLFCP